MGTDGLLGCGSGGSFCDGALSLRSGLTNLRIAVGAQGGSLFGNAQALFGPALLGLRTREGRGVSAESRSGAWYFGPALPHSCAACSQK